MQVKKRHKIRNAILLSIAGVLLAAVTVGGILIVTFPSDWSCIAVLCILGINQY
ncbi:MAG TPA: hypothetical protein GX401_09430 [Clostridiales bacterium]|nr:hypothetical protein [Clostridiales bacterium]